MKKKMKSTGSFVIAGMTAASLVSGCDNSTKQWESSPGTRGFINLKAVEKAFKKDSDVARFESRINEIFEGDHLVVFSSKPITGGFVLTAQEDLDKDKKPSEGDDPLFSLTVADGKATLQGMSVNSYYTSSWVYNPREENRGNYTRSHYHRPYFHYWYWGRGWGGYYTPMGRYDSIRQHRSSYRKSSAFRSQVKSNVTNENYMAKRYGGGFRKSAKSQSGVRKSYVSRTMKSSGFKQGLSGSKSTSGWGARGSSSSRGFGGMRGSSGFGV